MRRKRYYRKRRGRKRGRGIPYIYNSRVYLEKRPQKGAGVVSKVLAHLLQNVREVIGL